MMFFGIALVATLASLGLYSFLYIAMKNKTAATVPLLEKIEELSGRESRMTSSIAILRKEEANIEKLSAAFFNINDIVAFTKRIEELGVQSKTTLTIESLEQTSTSQGEPALNFRIRATGQFSNMERLLTLIENFPGKIQWKSVSLSHGNNGVASSWTMNISLSALNFVNQ